MSTSNTRTVGENPTCILGVKPAIPTLNRDSDIDSFFRTCAEAAADNVQPFLIFLTDKTTSTFHDPGETLSMAKKAADSAASPQKSSELQQSYNTAISEATPASGKKGKTPSTPTTSPRAQMETLKLLQESVKVNAQTGPVSAFLRNIILHQPGEITAHFETMDVNKKHPIYAAIDNCEIRTFKELLSEAFDEAHPRSDRIDRAIHNVQNITFDATSQDLLVLRRSLIETVKNINQLTDEPEYATQREYGMKTVLKHFRLMIDQITDLRTKLQLSLTMAVTRIMTVDRLQQILMKVDSDLRTIAGGNYVIPPTPIAVHVAQPSTEKRAAKPLCPACDARWGVKWNHLPDECYLAKPDKQSWREKTDKRWLEKNPGKELPPINQTSDRRKRPSSTIANSGTGDTSPSKKSSKERGM